MNWAFYSDRVLFFYSADFKETKTSRGNIIPVYTTISPFSMYSSLLAIRTGL